MQAGAPARGRARAFTAACSDTSAAWRSGAASGSGANAPSIADGSVSNECTNARSMSSVPPAARATTLPDNGSGKKKKKKKGRKARMAYAPPSQHALRCISLWQWMAAPKQPTLLSPRTSVRCYLSVSLATRCMHGAPSSFQHASCSPPLCSPSTLLTSCRPKVSVFGRARRAPSSRRGSKRGLRASVRSKPSVRMATRWSCSRPSCAASAPAGSPVAAAATRYSGPRSRNTIVWRPALRGVRELGCSLGCSAQWLLPALG